MNKLVLIDGSSLAFRAFYGLNQLDKFKTPEGLHTNALYAFHTMLDTILKREEPSHVLVAFDAGKTTFRTEMYADYKGGRDKMPVELSEQWPYFKVMLEALGVKAYDLVNYEADDIIGTLSCIGAHNGSEVVIVSGDRDMLQLVQEQVRVDITLKGSQIKSYTLDTIKEEYDLVPHQIIDMKGLMGDSSDNYPGVTKVGEKTALKLIQEFGSIDGVYAHVDSMKASKLKDNLIQDKENAYLSKTLATINTKAPITVSYDDTVYRGPQYDLLVPFYEKMHFKQFLNQLDVRTAEPVEEVSFTYLTSIDAKHVQTDGVFYVETLEDNYHVAQPVGVAFSNGGQVYVCDIETALQSKDFTNWLSDENRQKIVFDLKKESVLLNKHGVTLNGVAIDLSIAAYLLNASEKLVDVACVVTEYGVVLSSDEVMYGKGVKQGIPDKVIFHQFLAQKVASMEKVAPLVMSALSERGMLSLYEDMELPLASVLASMESVGISVTQETLLEMQKTLANRITELETTIHQLAGEVFNINSPKKLGEILFEKLALPAGKKTKTGYSTAVDVLEKLAHEPIVAEILLYRQLAKLQSTYVEGLQKYIQSDGKIHTRFVQTLTQTGRLSSTDPNLQNIPIRLEEGRKIRKAFVPSHKDWVLLSADYSQIELRVLAHIAQDKHMIAAFMQDEDIHTNTAMRVFGVAKENVDDQMRRQAKAVNFGIVYGISDYGLSQNLNITRKEAQQFIDTYFEKYPNIKQYMVDVVAQARELGYSQTLFNRRRYLPDLLASQFNIRSFAERTAMNTPIQGSAADIIKMAMVKLSHRMKESGLKSRLLLQVHDELILEVPKSEIDVMQQLVKDSMENAVQLRVPLKVDMSYGQTWYDAK